MGNVNPIRQHLTSTDTFLHRTQKSFQNVVHSGKLTFTLRNAIFSGNSNPYLAGSILIYQRVKACKSPGVPAQNRIVFAAKTSSPVTRERYRISSLVDVGVSSSWDPGSSCKSVQFYGCKTMKKNTPISTRAIRQFSKSDCQKFYHNISCETFLQYCLNC